MTILLPVGICFFTFGIISYLADLRWHSEARTHCGSLLYSFHCSCG